MATLSMPFELAQPDVNTPVARTSTIWDANNHTLDEILAGLTGGSGEPVDLSNYATKADLNNKANASTVSDHADRIADLEAALFPLKVSYGTSNDGVYEVGTSITPRVTWTVTRKGAVAVETATTSAQWGAFSSDKKSYAAASPVTLTENITFSASITSGSETKTLGTKTWAVGNYRYFGEVSADSFAASGNDVSTAIGVLQVLNSGSNKTKELSGTKYLGTASAPKTVHPGNVYIFAVKSATSVNFVVKTTSGGTINGCTTGSVTVQQENGYGDGNIYQYVVIPAPSKEMDFYIAN